MAGLEPAIQQARVRARRNSLATADAVALGGRVKPGHDEQGILANQFNPLHFPAFSARNFFSLCLTA